MNQISSKNWKISKLGDVAEITSSKRIFANEYSDTGVPFYRGKEIIEKQKGDDVSIELYITKEKFNEIKNKFGIQKTGDILLTSVGTLGIPYVVDEKDCFYFKDGNLTWFKNYKNIIPEFLYYWMLSPAGKESLSHAVIGSTQQAYTITQLNRCIISIPESIEEQKEIAEMLGSLDDKIELLRKENKTLESIAQTLFKEWFVDFNFPGSTGKMTDSELGEIPEGWSIGKLKDVLEIKNGFAFKSEDYIQDKQYPIIRTMNFEDSGYINSNNLVYISYEKAKEYKSFNFEEFDLCVVMVGASLGNIAMVTKINLPALQNQNMWSFKPKGKDFRFYINFQIKNIVKNNINSASGSARDFFRKDHFYNINILIPQDLIIFEFEKTVNCVYQKMSNNIVEIQSLSKLRDELLNRIFL